MLALGFDALGREDYDTLTLGYAPDGELNVFGSAAVGVAERYLGHEVPAPTRSTWPTRSGTRT